MPELPEVEIVRRGLARLLIGKTIQDLDIYWDNLIVAPSIPDFQAKLQGLQIQGIRRRGKYLLFDLGPWILSSHLRMEGKYVYFPQGKAGQKDPHTHLVVYFTDGCQVHYQDVRKFGRFECVRSEDEEKYFEAKGLGPEPVPGDFDLEAFSQAVRSRRKSIKGILLDQKAVAGLGNIYVDEVLFWARVHPALLGKDLSPEAIQRIHQGIIQVLAAAVQAGGTTIRTYQNSFGQEGSYQDQLQVYGRTGQACYRCGTPIAKIRLAQRGTHYCPQCQREEAGR